MKGILRCGVIDPPNSESLTLIKEPLIVKLGGNLRREDYDKRLEDLKKQYGGEVVLLWPSESQECTLGNDTLESIMQLIHTNESIAEIEILSEAYRRIQYHRNDK